MTARTLNFVGIGFTRSMGILEVIQKFLNQDQLPSITPVEQLNDPSIPEAHVFFIWDHTYEHDAHLAFEELNRLYPWSFFAPVVYILGSHKEEDGDHGSDLIHHFRVPFPLRLNSLRQLSFFLNKEIPGQKWRWALMHLLKRHDWQTALNLVQQIPVSDENIARWLLLKVLSAEEKISVLQRLHKNTDNVFWSHQWALESWEAGDVKTALSFYERHFYQWRPTTYGLKSYLGMLVNFNLFWETLNLLVLHHRKVSTLLQLLPVVFPMFLRFKDSVLFQQFYEQILEPDLFRHYLERFHAREKERFP